MYLAVNFNHQQYFSKLVDFTFRKGHKIQEQNYRVRCLTMSVIH